MTILITLAASFVLALAITYQLSDASRRR